MQDFLSTFFLWLVYYALHSVLALDNVKTWSHKHWKYHNQGYRLFYNVVAGLGLLGMLLWMRWHPGELLFSPVWYAGIPLSIAGLVIVYRGARKYDMGVFLGFTQWHHPKSLQTHEQTDLVITGLQKHIRHPLYTGTLLLLLGWFLLFPDHARAAWLTATLVYLPFGIFLEEQKLLRIFGPVYTAYKQKTGALWPVFSASKN